MKSKNHDLKEEMFFFPGSKKRLLLGFLHESPKIRQPAGIVYCHPFAEEKNSSHSIIVKTARSLAAQGFPVLRFDRSGCGDSEGNYEEVTINDWLEDIYLAIQLLKKRTRVEYYGLWGLRLGAAMAMLHIKTYNDARFLILWQPIFDLVEHIHQFLRSQISIQIAWGSNRISSLAEQIKQLEEGKNVWVAGYPVSKELYHSFISHKNLPFPQNPNVSILMLSISENAKPSRLFDKMNILLSDLSKTSEFFHIQAEPFWDRKWRWDCQEGSDYTLKWIQKIFASDV